MTWRKAVLGLALALTAALSAPQARAAEAEHPMDIAWSWEQPFGTYDRAAMQRGFLVYKQVCASCHGLKFLSYRNLGEAGGPFQAVATRKWQERGETPELGVPGHGKVTVNAIDNPYVKALAAEQTVTEIDANTGLEVERPARPADRFKSPFANEALARAANAGALPPDLSVITKARHYGADYVYSLLVGYEETPPPGVEVIEGKHYNPYFPGGWISMANQLQLAAEAESVTDAAGRPLTKEEMARDVVTFLNWAAEPKLETRKSLGFAVMIYLAVLSLLLYLAYKHVWRGVKH